MKKKCYLAIDLGASSGRVMAGLFDGRCLALEEVHRFENRGIRLPDGWHWDIIGLFTEIKLGMAQAISRYGKSVVSAGVDTWGVDYALVDGKGRLLGVPYMYRDERTQGMEKRVFRRYRRSKLYGITGIQSMFFNTVYQLSAEQRAAPEALKAAKRLLFTPDLIHYWLSGVMANEYTIASTSGLLDARKRKWSKEILRALDLPVSCFRDVVMPGTVLGGLRADLDLGSTRIKIVAPGSHDTASAVAAVPALETHTAYLSSGTWSLLGVELDAPLLTPQAQRFDFTNEGGVNDKIRLLKNVTGLWLLQECRRVWSEKGKKLSFAEIEAAARKAKPSRTFINPDDPSFAAPGDMPALIKAYCRKTGQRAPSDEGGMVRTIYESLALRYRQVLDMLGQLNATEFVRLHVVGGGSRDGLLNQLTADATGLPVEAGPVEATAIGNILVQMQSAGDVGSLREGRELVAASFPTTTYVPDTSTDWTARHEQFAALTK